MVAYFTYLPISKAHTRIGLWEWGALNSLRRWNRNESLNPGPEDQTLRRLTRKKNLPSNGFCCHCRLQSGNLKKAKKRGKYLVFAWQQRKLRNINVIIVPFVVNVLVMVPKGLESEQSEQKIWGRIKIIQPRALLRPAKILSRVLKDRRTDVIQNPMNDRQLKLVWKTCNDCNELIIDKNIRKWQIKQSRLNRLINRSINLIQPRSINLLLFPKCSTN